MNCEFNPTPSLFRRSQFPGVEVFAICILCLAAHACAQSPFPNHSVSLGQPRFDESNLRSTTNSEPPYHSPDLQTQDSYVEYASVQEILPFIGYDRGFVIAANRSSGDHINSAEFLMRVNSWLQLRHTLFDSDGPNLDQNTFSFERLRLSFGGYILAPDFKYFFQFDGNSDGGTGVNFLDYFITYDLGRQFLGLDESTFGLKLGKWKVPFSRSRAETGRMLQFTDRATANVLFDLNRSLGIGFSSRLEPTDTIGPATGMLEFETAIFNGFQTGNAATTREQGLDRNFGWCMRIHGDMFDEFGNDGEPDLGCHEGLALRCGGGIAFTRVDAEGSTEFNRQRVVDSGATLSSLVRPLGVSAYDVWLYTIDAHLKCRGFSLITEYYWRYMTQFNSGLVPSLLDDGFVLQSGYFVVDEKLELIARWSRIVGNSGTLGVLKESSDEVGAGFVWYIQQHNLKFTLDISHFTGAPVNSSRLDLLPGDAGWMVRSQFQAAF